MPKLLLVLVATAATLAAQNPTITSIVNAASGIPTPGFPNYGIAQGAIFVVTGSNLGPSALQAASLPLPTTAGLGGTTIAVTLNVPGPNGTMTNLAPVTAPIYSTSSTQVVAVLPSNTPPGSGTLTLTYNGYSGASPIRVMPANFGIFNTLNPFANNGVGVLGFAAVTFADTQAYVSATNTAAPGDTLILWGTGLGAAPNGSDTGAAPVGNIGSSPLNFGGSNIGSAPLIFAGGVQSPSVTYWGRAPNTIPGLDQIEFVVPQNAPLGCNVSIVVQVTNPGGVVVSNAPVLALGATDGATCSDPTQLFTPSLLSNSSLKFLVLGIHETVAINPSPNGPATTSTSSSASVQIGQLTTSALTAGDVQGANAQPSFGSCYTGFASSQSNGPFPATFMNAGASVTLTPPSGSALTLNSQSTGVYGSANSSATLPGGTWSFSNGSGGADVGPLSFSFPVPQPVTWTNQAAVSGSPILRANPLTITWTGGDANGWVDIQGYTRSAPGPGAYNIGFECGAPTSAGQFTIPPSILLGMPGGGVPGQITVSTYAIPSSIGNIPGLDAALDGSQFQTQAPVAFQ